MGDKKLAPPPPWAYNYAESVRARFQRVKREGQYWHSDLRVGMETYRSLLAAKVDVLDSWERHHQYMTALRFEDSELWRRLK